MSVAVGRYVGARSAVRVGVERLWARQDTSQFVGRATFDSQFAQIEWVGDLGTTWDYALDATFRLPESGLEGALLQVSGAVFPTPRLELGGEFSVFTGDPLKRTRTYNLFGRWFLNDRWSASLRFGWEDEDRRQETNPDLDRWWLGVQRRF